MIHPLTPDLTDPNLCADVALPSLQKAFNLQQGEIRLTFDPTLREPVRIRPTPDTLFDVEAGKDRFVDMLETLSTAAAPFVVSFLKAQVRQCGYEPCPLDLMTVVSGLRLIYLRAQNQQALLGDIVEVVLSLTMPKDDEQDVIARVDCNLVGHDSVDRRKRQAVEEYCTAVRACWARLCRTEVGCWALDSGMREFRLTARIFVDPRQALAALGHPRAAERLPHTHTELRVAPIQGAT